MLDERRLRGEDPRSLVGDRDRRAAVTLGAARDRHAHLAAIGRVAQGVVEQRVEGAGLSVVRSLVGHGIGRDMHEDPQIPNYGQPGRGPLLEPGMVLALEPAVYGDCEGVRLEQVVLVTEDGCEVLSDFSLEL